MALVQHLQHRIVAAHIKFDPVDADGFRVHVLVVAQPVEIGRNERLHDERAVVGEMGGDIFEAAHLFFLCQQVE